MEATDKSSVLRYFGDCKDRNQGPRIVPNYRRGLSKEAQNRIDLLQGFSRLEIFELQGF